MTESRAMTEVATEATRLVTVQIMSAIESRDWAAVTRLSDRLQEIAGRGLYHQSIERMAETTALAMGNHQEREAR